MYKEVPDALHLAVTVPCSMIKVRHLLTTAEGLDTWLATDADFTPRIGFEYTLRLHDGDLAEGAVQGFDPSYGLAYTFTHEVVRRAFGNTIVRWSWEALSPDYTLVTLIHTGHGQGDSWQKAYTRNLDIWTFGLRNLFSVVSYSRDLRKVASPEG